MAKKKVAAIVKIQIEAGKASPAPPVGTALGPHGIAIMDFVKAYNAQYRGPGRHRGADRDHDLRGSHLRLHPQDAAGPGADPQGARSRQGRQQPRLPRPSASITEAQVEEIAKIKMPDLNANDLEAAKQQIRGTARSMGIAVG